MARSKQAKNSTFAVNAVAFTAMYVFALCALPLMGDVNFAHFKETWNLYLAAAICFNIVFLLYYKAASYLDSAVISVLTTSTALYTILMAGLIYGEKLTSAQIVGASLLLPCIWYVASLTKKQHKLFSKKDFRDKHWLKGLLLMLVAGFFLSLGHIIEKQVFATSSIGSFIAFGFLIDVVIAWVLFFALGRSQARVFKNNFLMSGALKLGLLRMLLGLCFFYALVKSDNLTLVTLISNFRIVIVAVLAGWLLGEKRYYYKKLAAAAMSVVALSIIFWN